MAGNAQNMVFSTGAQPSATGEEESVEGSSQARTASSNDLSQEDEDFMRHDQDDCAEKSAPEVPAGSTNGKFRKMKTTLKNTWAKFPSSKSNLKVVNKIDQLKLSKRGSEDMNVLLGDLISDEESKKYGFQLRGIWQDIQGGHDWAGLLDPKHSMYAGMRSEIYRYGTFAKAAYDAFDKNSKSTNRGCKYLKEELLKEVGLNSLGYEISHLLYTTSEVHLPKFMSKLLGVRSRKSSNWMGFVAVCTSQDEIDRLGRRDIVVAWRGTVTKTEWIKDIQFWCKPIECNPQNADKPVTVESGFLSVYNCSNDASPFCKNSAKDQVLEAVKELVKKHEEEDKQKDVMVSITVTGHSLGSALALLCAYDIAKWMNQSQENSSFGPDSGGLGTSEETFGDSIPVTVFSFAGPPVGKRAFTKRIQEFNVKVLRVFHKHDVVPKPPGFRSCLSYKQFGEEFEISQLTREETEATEKTSSSKEKLHILHLPTYHRLKDILKQLSFTENLMASVSCSLLVAHTLWAYRRR